MYPHQHEVDRFIDLPKHRITTLEPVKVDKDGAGYSSKDVYKFIINEIITGASFCDGDRYFKRNFDKMNSELKEVGQEFDKAFGIVETKMQSFTQKTENVEDATKKASGKIKKSANDVLVSIEKLEKLANFDKLEKLADTLERISSSLSILSEIDKKGSLDGVVRAITKP